MTQLVAPDPPLAAPVSNPDAGVGLTSAEATRRLAGLGPNALEVAKGPSHARVRRGRVRSAS